MATRRTVRLRREYLYRKSLEGKDRQEYEAKRRIRQALAEGKAIPTELKRQEKRLRHEIEMEDEVTEKPKPTIDDEYASAGVMDPKVCVTTSREPSSRLKQFAKEVRLIFPNAQRVNRGGTTVKELVDACRKSDFTDIVVLQETRGEPDALIVSHLPYGPTAFFSLSNCVMRHDIEDRGTVSEAYPHLIFHNFKSSLGDRVVNVLKHLFPVPKDGSQRVCTFSNTSDCISFRHHNYTKTGREVTLKEVGPRFELRPYQVRLGTLDQSEAENEWVLRPYMNTARKRQRL